MRSRPFPTNSAWQRDLSVSHYKLGALALQAGREDEAVAELRRCAEGLRGMVAKGMHLDPQTAQVLAQLEQMGL